MHSIAVIGVGNMAKAIISGIEGSSLDIKQISLFDKNTEQYTALLATDGNRIPLRTAESIADAIKDADTVLLSVKPQNYPEVLGEICAVPEHEKKLYISIGAGITSQSVSEALNNASVVRVLPNVPMLIGKGVSVICRAPLISSEKFNFVCDIFNSAGSIILIDEKDMNTFIGVTSSSPAYVFRFISALYDGALAQGLRDEGQLLDAICDVVIGSAEMLKNSSDTPKELVAKVASKGGTTERALAKLDEYCFDDVLLKAMQACTQRANELGDSKK